MTKHIDVPEVGAPDPERRNSPIFDDESEEEEYMDLELESGVCYFNDAVYRVGDYVSSGNELLRCVDPGVWIRTGTSQAR